MSDYEIDLATGLSGKQKRLVTETWGIIRQDPQRAGIAIMSHLFTSHPDYQQMFKAFKDVPLDVLPGHGKFKAHCVAVINALSATIDSLDNPSVLEAKLVTLGQRHHRRGQTKEHFLNLKVTVLAVLESSLASKWNADVEDAWDQTLDCAYSLIFKAYE